MIAININTNKIAKEHMFEGKAGRYLDLVLFENKDGRDQYGNDGFVVQSVSKAKRQAGERGPIVGNWKDLEKKQMTGTTFTPKAAPSSENDATDDIPF